MVRRRSTVRFRKGALWAPVGSRVTGCRPLPRRLEQPTGLGPPGRCSSARQSKRLIIAVSPVQIRPPLPVGSRPAEDDVRSSGMSKLWFVLVRPAGRGTAPWPPPTFVRRSLWRVRCASTATTSRARTAATIPTAWSCASSARTAGSTPSTERPADPALGIPSGCPRHPGRVAVGLSAWQQGRTGLVFSLSD